jgi:hypothetical protein
MQRTIIALLALCGGSPAVDAQEVQPPELHEYTVTGDGVEAFRKAVDTCAKLGRRVSEFAGPTSADASDSKWQIKFQCYVPYEVASVGGGDSYKIQVPTEMMGTVSFTIPAANGFPARTIRVPDQDTASARVDQIGREFCGRLNGSMKIVGGGFDMGPGLRVIFKCVPPQ